MTSKNNFFTLIIFFVLSFSLWAQESYYAGLIQDLDKYSSKQIKAALHKISTLYHLKHPGGVDTLHLKDNPNFKMKKHSYLSYNEAKSVVYNHLETIGPDHNEVRFRPVHCDQYYTVDIPWGYGVKEALLSQGFNIEHLRPRSTFNPYGPPEKATEFNYMMADLHHLLVAEAQVNRARKSYPFAEVKPISGVYQPNDSKLGINKLSKDPNQIYFEPSTSSKGGIARALFYISTRYKLSMDPVEEFYLRKWHRQYKVTPEEVEWNNIAFSRQYNRNPFVDYPELVNLIENFQDF